MSKPLNPNHVELGYDDKKLIFQATAMIIAGRAANGETVNPETDVPLALSYAEALFEKVFQS